MWPQGDRGIPFGRQWQLGKMTILRARALESLIEPTRLANLPVLMVRAAGGSNRPRYPVSPANTRHVR